MLGVSVKDGPRELRAAVLAMRRADNDVRKDVAQRMRSTMGPVWKAELAGASPGGMAGRVLTANARMAAGNPPQLVTANSGRKIGRGLIPTRHWAGYEYGANPASLSTVTNAKGTTFKRHTKRHLPGKSRAGHVIGPAVARVLPRIASFWTQSVVKAFMDAADRKG